MGRSDGHIYILRGKIRRSHIYTNGEDQTNKYIYTIRLNNRLPLKQRGKIRRTYIYTKGEDQTDIYIYTKGEDLTDTYICTKGEDQMDTYIL